MISTENVGENKKVFAGFFVRFIAYMIDSLIAGIAVGMITIPLRIMSGSVDFLSANFLFQFTVIDVISYVGVAAYFVLLTYYAHTTLGKMLLHLEVVSKKDNWSIINIIYRETVGRFLSSIGYIGYLATLVTKEKQGFHDMLCDTCVVYKGMEKSEKNIVPAAPVKVKEYYSEMPQRDTMPEYHSDVPEADTMPEYQGDVSEAATMPEYHSQIPNADTTPQYQNEDSEKIMPPTYH